MEKELIVLFHVALAALLAGIIGLERETYQKPAGLRTNMIVGGATALIISLGEIIVVYYNEHGLNEYVSADPIRIIQAIVVGVSFIGAGTVLHIEKEYKIKYLTTAATILFSTGLGIAVALHQYYLSVGVSVFILIINLIVGKVEDVLIKKKKR